VEDFFRPATTPGNLCIIAIDVMIYLFDLLQQMAIFLLIAYLFSKSPAFKPLASDTLLVKHKLFLFFIFSGFATLGSYVGLPIHDAVFNASAIGNVIAGLIGGPVIGLAVGAVSGLFSLFFGQLTLVAVAQGLSAIAQGLLGGMVHLYLQRKNQSEQLFCPSVALLSSLGGAILQLAVLRILVSPTAVAWPMIHSYAFPMIVANALGAALFMTMMRDQKTMLDKVGAMFSAKALNIAERSLGILSKGFNQETAGKLAEIIYDETGVGAVGISDCETTLAFVGDGADHHRPGLTIASPQTREAIRENKVIYSDGVREKFSCALREDCPLGSALIVPLRADNEVVGTIKLYEPKHKLFLNLNKTLGEGIARLLSEQLLRDRYENQKNLLVKSELKLIQAQVNPHFLFNALNTIVAVVRKDPDQARSLLLHLSNYFRKNLKRSSDLATLEEELDHVNSYLVIQKARFGEKLIIEQDIDAKLLKTKVPTFTLQPIVENAIKHGISNMLNAGKVRITARREEGRIFIEVIDDAGAYCEKFRTDGLGMNIVDKRIKNLYGSQFGTEIACVPEEMTKVSLILPDKNGVVK